MSEALIVATITFAGAPLTLAITLGQKASGVFPHHHDRRIIFEGGFVAAVVLLALAVLIGIRALRPALRHRTNPDLLKHYGIHGAESDEVNTDTYRREVALVVSARRQQQTSRSRFNEELAGDDETELRAHMHWAGDDQRHARLAVRFIHMPTSG